MPLSSKPTTGPTLPAGVRRVSLKDIDTSSTTAKEDITDLDSTERVYAEPPLKDGGAGTATQTCTASGTLKGSEFGPTATTVKTGWILEDCEFVFEAGKYATWSANWSYYPPTTTGGT